MSDTLLEQRSTIANVNLQEYLDAEDSAKWATLQGANQYFTPPDKARDWVLRVRRPEGQGTGIDPQFGEGNLLSDCWYPYGIELDNRIKRDNVINDHCVNVMRIIDDMFPDLVWEYGHANPPFAKRWKVGDQVIDSTQVTWDWLIRHACQGVFISNLNTIRALGIDQHPCVFAVEEHADLWPDCKVVVGVVFWRSTLVATNSWTLQEAWRVVAKVSNEEKGSPPKHNIWFRDGKLRTYLSTRSSYKLSREEILRVHSVNDCHPLTLTTERDTRRTLEHLIHCGVYTIEPGARQAMADALAQVNRLARPIMPPTSFETVAYADEEDTLQCVAPNNLGFLPGKSYPLDTGSYRFSESFIRNKLCYSDADGESSIEPHECVRTGVDRYIAVRNERGCVHRFMDKPDPQNHEYDHEEAGLWQVFARPVVKTVADEFPGLLAANRDSLDTIELLAGFTYYAGQKEYLARIGVKDCGLVAAGTGCGKTLMAISMIAMKSPRRCLIIAPQGLVRAEDDDDPGAGGDYQASQWVREITRFAPYLNVFQVFNREDVASIRRCNHGTLPAGVYISYYQAMFSNGARETLPESWDDERLNALGRELGLPPLPPVDYDSSAHAHSVGKEQGGIRCVVAPCMATELGDIWDMIVLDEAHVATHLSSNVTQMIIRMRARHRWALTATPIPNVVSDLFPLMGWLCVEEWFKGAQRNAAWPFAREDLVRFENTFLSVERDLTQEAKNSRRNPKWRGKCESVSPVISAPARLLKILKPTMAYVSKQQCNPSLVACNTVDIRVPLGAEQARLYGHFLDRGNVPARNPMTRAMKQMSWLRAICADPAGFAPRDACGYPVVRTNFNPKLIAVMELVRDILRRGEQVVVVSARIGQTDTIADCLTDVGLGYSRIDSTVPAHQHSQAASRFKSGQARIALMGIKCAQGYSFSQCNNLIVSSLEYTYGSLHQAEGRVFRVDSKAPVSVYCVLHQGSVEEIMFDKVATKGDSATICLHGQRVPRDFKPVDMSEIMADTAATFSVSGLPEESALEQEWQKLKLSFAC